MLCIMENHVEAKHADNIDAGVKVVNINITYKPSNFSVLRCFFLIGVEEKYIEVGVASTGDKEGIKEEERK